MIFYSDTQMFIYTLHIWLLITIFFVWTIGNDIDIPGRALISDAWHIYYNL